MICRKPLDNYHVHVLIVRVQVLEPSPGSEQSRVDDRAVSSLVIRPAHPDDLEPIAAMADDRRRQYAEYQPVFWRPAPDAAARQRPYLASLIADVQVITLVAISDGRVVGFVIGHLVPAPAVYDPGGPTCSIDDFAVERPASWATVGVELLRAVQEDARQRGATQLVVVCGHLDEAKRAALEYCRLTIASEWWVAPLAPNQ